LHVDFSSQETSIGKEDPQMDLINLIKDQLNNPDVLKNLSNTVGADTNKVCLLVEAG